MNSYKSFSTSVELREQASRYIAGGVVSLNRKVDPFLVFREGRGSKIYDAEGKEYIDYHAAFAPHLLGHNNETINKAVHGIIDAGWSLFGTGTNELEIRLCELLCSLVPSLELVQITNTGSEATAHAIRLSRAFTGKDDVILMMGGYNGWHNEVARQVMPPLSQVGPRRTRDQYPFIPLSAGIPEATRQKIHVVNFNDLESVEFVLKNFPVACVLTEPVLQNIGVVLPDEGYLQGLYDLCERYNALCIFDEVKTGFRTGLGGYQEKCGVSPHLSVFGKAVANGYPLGVIGGRRDIMELFDHPDPSKRVLIAGTYNAHPVNVAAALTTLELLQNGNVYEYLNSICDELYSGLKSIFREKGFASALVSNASAFCVYFMDHAPTDMHDILAHHQFDFDLLYRRKLIDKGIYHIPLACKQGSVSFAHSNNDISNTLEITRAVIKEL